MKIANDAVDLPSNDSALPISAAWLAALAAAAISMTLGYPVARIIFASELEHGAPEAFIALTTGLLSMCVVLRASGRQTRTACAFSAASWSFFAGGLNAGFAAQYQAWGRPADLTFGPFLVATIIGFVFAAPLSAGFAIVNSALALGAVEAKSARSHQSLDLMLGYAGAAVAAFGALRLTAVPDGWALLPILSGSVLASIGFGRARARRAWLRAVDLGEVPGLSIEVLDGDVDASLPCLLGKADAATAVLVRDREDGQHYRAGQREQHIAVIDPWGP